MRNAQFDLPWLIEDPPMLGMTRFAVIKIKNGIIKFLALRNISTTPSLQYLKIYFAEAK